MRVYGVVIRRLMTTTQTVKQVEVKDSILKYCRRISSNLSRALNPRHGPITTKLALVSAPEIERYQQLAIFGEGVIKQSLDVAVFYDMKEAISWRSDIR